jgi:hypothetical protein
MVDANIKQVRIRNSELPYVQFTTVYNQTTMREEIDELYYNIRYRVVSEDKNRVSQWSPIKAIIMPQVTSPFPYTQPNRISIEKAGGHVNVLWSKPQVEENPTEFENIINQVNIYDVWARWNLNNTTDPNNPGWGVWQYEATVSSNVWSGFPPNGAKSVEIAIQIPTVRKIRDYNNNRLTMFTSIKSSL